MAMTQDERRMRHLKQDVIAFTQKPPSIKDMTEGEIRFSLSSGNNLTMYVRKGNKLWFSELAQVSEGDSLKWGSF
jgi:hypothetical protein|tara:strand:+ start:408 stop:632 length:225 start_codon:yes stop_codon:yes gene_type:complete